MTTQEKPRVLIIGAGFAGVTLATKINGFADVTVIDPKEYLEITWATVRSIVDESVALRSIISLKDIPNIGRLVQATVTRLTAKEAVLSNGETLTFDYAAICTGSSYSDAFKSSISLNRERRLEELKGVNEEIRAARSIVVVGGGAAGVEVAAEVVEAYAGKAITLVHPGKQLLSTAPPKAGAKAKQFLESKGVKVQLGVSVQSQPAGRGAATLTLSDGSNLTADLVLWCAGAKPNTAYLGEDLAAVRDDKGLIKVLPTLQVEDHPNIFALGDCNNVPEEKKGFLAMKQAELAAASIKALIKASKSGKPPKLGVWTPNMGMEMLLVTLGRSDGVCRMGGSVFTGFLPAWLKGKDLFIGKTRAQLRV
ncbi:hypothetical protein Vretimale_17578 [Volvox reticuliferus]|uniref:Uncharacterized protein n=1 Tax=Volvox reticuliferus TaxID=1737510 RepID=A0A8J4GVJ3_9CHLO|nr:hypothetical protein Vretifemale_3541 [Volvox reticuliferus]GIM14767.1 hypothetical protein Vretimale_17578 [Volvox reticuliferus]